MLIELVGPPGVGKTTLREELLTRLPSADLDLYRILPMKVAAEPAPRRLIRLARHTALVARQPSWIAAALRDPAGHPFRAQLRWTTHLCTCDRTIRRLRAGRQTAVIEDGVVRALVDCATALSVDWARRRARAMALPDLMVILRAEPAAIAERAIARGGRWSALPLAVRAANAERYYERVDGFLDRLETRIVYRDTQALNPAALAGSLMAELAPPASAGEGPEQVTLT